MSFIIRQDERQKIKDTAQKILAVLDGTDFYVAENALEMVCDELKFNAVVCLNQVAQESKGFHQTHQGKH